jgi:hypothetical protein
LTFNRKVTLRFVMVFPVAFSVIQADKCRLAACQGDVTSSV